MVKKQKVSPGMSFEGFDWKTFLLGFKKPAIMLITAGLSCLAGYSDIAIVAGISAERVWALIEFWIKRIPLK